ncbi:hypothetical protein TSUD_126980 [Trifolium subterraneum]|nr:hypothetical protein TSUD_126980 [Trifolium subterraneum]
MAAAQFGIILVLAACLLPFSVDAMVRHYKFNVVLKNATRLCSTKPIVTINGKFPGPTIYAREDDNVLIKVVNHVKYNVSIHWHGVKQLRTGWADGPAYITQCEWWKSDTEAIINEALKSGLAPNISDAHTINGLPGPGQGCASQDGFSLEVQPKKTYLLRIVNAALNEELFFKIANHELTVVEVDATYVKPFKTNTIVIAPGQTTNVLLETKQTLGNYLVAASPFMDAPIIVDNKTAIATLHYSNTLGSTITSLTSLPPKNATPIANTFTDSLRSLNSKKYPANVPLKIDHKLLFTVSLGVWFMHCHLEIHTTWGLKMAFVVDNGKGPNESLLPPPSDLPKC